MIELLELAVDLWMFGLPVVFGTWAVLRSSEGFSGRARYLLAVSACVVAVGLPVTASLIDIVPVTGGAAGAGVTLSTPPPLLMSLLAAIWAGGAVVLLSRDLYGHCRLYRSIRRTVSAPDDLRSALSWPADVSLVVGEIGPMTTGLLRSVVCIPASMDTSALRTIAAHELSHARWRDPFVYAVLRSAFALVWLGPFWPMLRWVRREREAAADEAAVGTSRDPETYIAALVQLARGRFAHRHLVSTVAGSDLVHRISRILEPRRSRPSLAALLMFLAATAGFKKAEPAQYTSGFAAPSVRLEVAGVVTAPVVLAVMDDRSVLQRRVRAAPRDAEALPAARSLSVSLAPRLVSRVTESPPPAIAERPAPAAPRNDQEVIVIRNVIRR